MPKKHMKPELLLEQLGFLSSSLMAEKESKNLAFDKPLEIMREVLSFDLSILYKILNIVDEYILILEVVQISDPSGGRRDLYPGKKIAVDINRDDPIFVNEILAFKYQRISNVNVPGAGCDMVGYIYLPDTLGGSYLFGGDYLGNDGSVNDDEINVCEITCNLLSSLLMKSAYEEMAIYDGLTTLYNSDYIKSELSKIMKRHDRNNDLNISIVLADIDFFKKVNDSYGHIQGDSVLKEVGEILKKQMRESFDTVGRYGGEEFLIVMEGIPKDKIVSVVERICKSIEEYKFIKMDKNGDVLFKESLSVTMSFGVANIMDHKDSKEFIANADKALYHAKENGRNQVVLADNLE